MTYQNDLFGPPRLERRAAAHVGHVFSYAGRGLLVVKSYGAEPAAPVIVEELSSFGPKTLKGQLGLWCNDSVLRAQTTAAVAITKRIGQR